MNDHERYMAMALEDARAAGRAGNRPIASLIEEKLRGQTTKDWLPEPGHLSLSPKAPKST